MADDKKYNGWTNYETWNVKLWMDNEQPSYEFWKEQAQEAYDNADAGSTFTRPEQATLDLSHTMKDQFEGQMCEMLEAAGQSASMWSDLLGAALAEVNWHEIAEHLIDDVDKGAEA